MMVRALSGRLRILWVLLLAFVAFNGLVRLGLALFNGEASPLMPWRLLPALLIGAGFDVGTASFFLAPLGLLVLSWRDGPGRWLRRVLLALLLPLCVLAVFVAFSEFTFWNEFASRFNFIAVDYLIYTNEVVGNIRESYNLPLLLTGMAALALLLWASVARALRPLWAGQLGWRPRLVAVAVLLALPPLAVALMDERFKEFSSDGQANELAGNGYYDFWHAFWANEIDYSRFYLTMPRERALLKLAARLGGKRLDATLTQRAFARDITAPGPMKRLNVVMISVESYSAEFMAAFGNTQKLTPATDRLAREGLLFT
ncbi:MAG: LTA synthase family protein, partial [Burkholderiales bacterium]|nr:LTA synthase family protein [Burkholderiales bacterium]